MYNYRKDTKKYKDLVEKYCNARCAIANYTKESEKQRKQIEQYQAELDKGIYNDVVNGALSIAITMTKMADWGQWIPDEQEIIDRCGKQLEAEYGDDLDKVFAAYKNKW